MILEFLREKKVVFFVPEAPPSYAGSGINAFNFARLFSEYAKQTTLCHLNYNRKQEPVASAGRLNICRITYYNRNLLTKIASLPCLLFYYYRQVQLADIILIYSGYLIGFQFIILVSSLLHKKVIFRSSMIDGDDARSLLKKNFFLRIVNRFALKRISLYFAINPEFSRRFRECFQEGVPVFDSFQGVDASRFFPVNPQEKFKLKERLGTDPNNQIIVSVGIVLRRKGYEEIFNALSTLNSKYIYYVLGETGKNPFRRMTKQEEKEIYDLISFGKKVLGDKIVFKGAVPDPETYLQAADIYIHGAEKEGTPNALLEAMACGLPCFVKKLPGVEGHLTIHNQNTVEFGHYSELPGKINKSFSDPDHMGQIKKEAAKKILENYTFEMVAKKLVKKMND